VNAVAAERKKVEWLGGYAVACRELLPDAAHDVLRYANNRAELSHQPTRVRERGMRRLAFASWDRAAASSSWRRRQSGLLVCQSAL
jgi:transposase-like protein